MIVNFSGFGIWLSILLTLINFAKFHVILGSIFFCTFFSNGVSVDLVLYLFLCDFFQVSLLWCPNTAVFTRFYKRTGDHFVIKIEEETTRLCVTYKCHGSEP